MPGYGSMLVFFGLIAILGSLISLIGAIMIDGNPFKARTIILTGSIVGGINLITLIGGFQIKKEL